jgi:hypothetical protein
LAAAAPKPSYVENLLHHSGALRDQPWQRFRVKDGQKGPQVWEVKHTQIFVKDENGLPVGPWHLIVCRNVLHPAEVKFFVSNAPPEITLEELLLVAFSRWRVERCFEDQKGEVGLDHYEGRHYVGLKRHLILSAVSFLFLSQVRERLRGEKPGIDNLPSAHGSLGTGEVLVA